MSKILIIMPNWIGDFLLALSVVKHKASIENADITLLVPCPLVKLCRLLCNMEIIPYNRKPFKEFHATINIVRSRKFNVVYILPPSFSSAWSAFRSGIPRRRGILRDLRGFLLTDALPESIRNNKQHITCEYSILLETDYNPPEYWQGFPVEKSKDHTGVIILCPGSRFGPAKRWPYYKELVDCLHGKKIVLLGGPEDFSAGENIEAAFPERVENLIGKTSLAQAAAIISAAGLVVSNDSGLMHLAGFLGTPVVGIFGSTSPIWTRPLGKNVIYVKTKCDCSPCFKRTCRFHHYNCMKNITPQHVASVADQLMRERA
jgi:heptosyltransferase II